MAKYTGAESGCEARSLCALKSPTFRVGRTAPGKRLNANTNTILLQNADSAIAWGPVRKNSRCPGRWVQENSLPGEGAIAFSYLKIPFSGMSIANTFYLVGSAPSAFNAQ